MGTNAGEGWGDPRVQVVSVFRSTDSDGSLAYVALFALWPDGWNAGKEAGTLVFPSTTSDRQGGTCVV